MSSDVCVAALCTGSDLPGFIALPDQVPATETAVLQGYISISYLVAPQQHFVTSGCVVLIGTSAPDLEGASPVAADLAELGPAAARQVLLQSAQETAPEWQPNSALKCAAWTLLANFGPGGLPASWWTRSQHDVQQAD